MSATLVVVAAASSPALAAATPDDATPPDTLAACPAGTVGVPVLLIHGTNADVERSLGPTRQALADDGRCVYGPDFDSTRPLSESVDYFAAVVEHIRAVNGVDVIDVVGKSQGGLIARAVSLKFAGQQSNPIRNLVTVSGPHQGVTEFAGSTNLNPVALLVPGLPAAAHDMLAGSEFLTELDADGMTAPGVRYTLIGTRTDRIVTPYTSSFIDAPNTTDILIQDGCPEDLAGHLAESADPRTIDLTLNALDPVRHHTVRCVANDDQR
ncbi:alpha/beta fold hydrolase [Nocardia stercoris]|nr:alpha/beta fold hydrolase [Nocardia stercoris]